MGIPLTVDGDTYALSRAASPAAAPSEAPAAAETYGRVPVTLLNWDEYFTVSQSSAGGYTDADTYQVICTAYIAPTTSYDQVNVQFHLSDYGDVIVPANGNGVISRVYATLYRILYKNTFETQIRYFESAAQGATASPPKVTSVSGFMRMSRAEADAANEKLYAAAARHLDNASTLEECKLARSVFEALKDAGHDFENSLQRMFEAMDKHDELQAQIYDEGKTLEAQERYEEAIEKFRACGYYSDCADHMAYCRKCIQYQEALDLEAQGKKEEAIEAYGKLGDFKDAAERLANLERHYADEIKAEFSCGRAPIQRDGYLGYIDTNGDAVIPCQYLTVFPFTENLALVKSEADEYGVIDPDGNVVVPFGRYEIKSSFSEGLAAVTINGKCGYIDKTGEILIPAIYRSAHRFKDGYALVSFSEHVLGFIDKQGNMVIEPQFYQCNPGNGFPLPVRMDPHDKWGYISESGKLVFRYICDKAGLFSEGLAFVEIEGEQFFINEQGQRVLNLPGYQSVSPFFEGRAIIGNNGRYGAIDREGNVVVPIEYDAFNPVLDGGFHEGTIAAKKDGKWGIIDVDGNVVIPFEYDAAFPYNEGFCIVMKGDTFTIFDAEGNAVNQ